MALDASWQLRCGRKAFFLRHVENFIIQHVDIKYDLPLTVFRYVRSSCSSSNLRSQRRCKSLCFKARAFMRTWRNLLLMRRCKLCLSVTPRASMHRLMRSWNIFRLRRASCSCESRSVKLSSAAPPALMRSFSSRPRISSSCDSTILQRVKIPSTAFFPLFWDQPVFEINHLNVTEQLTVSLTRCWLSLGCNLSCPLFTQNIVRDAYRL